MKEFPQCDVRVRAGENRGGSSYTAAMHYRGGTSWGCSLPAGWCVPRAQSSAPPLEYLMVDQAKTVDATPLLSAKAYVPACVWQAVRKREKKEGARKATSTEVHEIVRSRPFISGARDFLRWLDGKSATPCDVDDTKKQQLMRYSVSLTQAKLDEVVKGFACRRDAGDEKARLTPLQIHQQALAAECTCEGEKLAEFYDYPADHAPEFAYHKKFFLEYDKLAGSKKRNLLLQGEKDCGKSTALAWLLLDVPEARKFIISPSAGKDMFEAAVDPSVEDPLVGHQDQEGALQQAFFVYTLRLCAPSLR
jgi:hypothetical protein